MMTIKIITRISSTLIGSSQVFTAHHTTFQTVAPNSRETAAINAKVIHSLEVGRQAKGFIICCIWSSYHSIYTNPFGISNFLVEI